MLSGAPRPEWSEGGGVNVPTNHRKAAEPNSPLPPSRVSKQRVLENFSSVEGGASQPILQPGCCFISPGASLPAPCCLPPNLGGCSHLLGSGLLGGLCLVVWIPLPDPRSLTWIPGSGSLSASSGPGWG